MDVASAPGDNGLAVSGTLTTSKEGELVWSDSVSVGMWSERIAAKVLLDNMTNKSCKAESQEWKKNKKKK
jgi:hypothetical protein